MKNAIRVFIVFFLAILSLHEVKAAHMNLSIKEKLGLPSREK